MQSPPETDRDPVAETIHDDEIVDPYRWLEDDDEAVEEWEHAQNANTDEFVQTARRDALQSDFESVGNLETYFLPVARGGRYFQRIEAAGEEQPALTIRDSLEAEPRTLVSPAELDEKTALQWFVPDPDGELLLYGAMDAGTEQYDLRVLSVESETIIDSINDVGRCNPMSVAWTDEGFYYMATGSADEGTQLEKELRYCELDGENRCVTADVPQERWPMVEIDRETGLVVVAVGELAADAELYALVDGTLEDVVTGVDAAFEPLVANGAVYVRTDYEAPHGRVLRIGAADFPDADGLSDFETVVPEGEDVIAEVEAVDSGLAIHKIRDARSVLALHDASGTHRYDCSLPEFVGIPRQGLSGSEASTDLFVHLAGFDRVKSVVRVSASSASGPDEWTTMQYPTLPADLDPQEGLELTAERLWVDSTDGARVPVYVVHRAELEPDADTPALLYGYGGFRIPMLPNLDSYRLPFLADSGVFALACLRGGLERGEQWHEDGSRAQKEHTFDDFEAAAEALVEEGYTSHENLAARGGSNGGLTVGAALTRSPELFGAVVCNVPLLDMLRFHRFLLGQAWTGEYGSPENETEYEWLRSYSPYHNVESRAYPPTLFTTAAGDTRVHPAHARKMAARVQHATTGDGPICYRSVTETGHGVGTPTSVEIELELDRWAFVYEMLDIERV